LPKKAAVDSEGGVAAFLSMRGMINLGYADPKKGEWQRLLNHLCPSFESIGNKTAAQGCAGGSTLTFATVGVADFKAD
jgi:hypothetical protein